MNYAAHYSRLIQRARGRMFEGGFVVIEHPTVKAAAAFAGLNRCTVRDRVKRNHPLWGYVK